MSLTSSRFKEYFQAIHNDDPFPWQQRLLDRVLAEGWPACLSLPTASGKTALLDVAVFALACQSAGGGGRTTPRRIALVVDRRIVVDESFARANRIRVGLLEADDGILREVAQALLALGGESPLEVAQLRGGIYREDRWARTPVQPTILCSTVDQVGSRLLFRGYGLSSSMWPIHAGLLGNDCLIVLDEAHCSEPFRQTAEWIAKLRTVGPVPGRAPFRFVTMTATPRSGEEPFMLETDDWNNAVLMKRLQARKVATLHTCDAKDEDFVKAAVEKMEPMLLPGATVLAVVNRVSTARALRELLVKRTRASGCDRREADVILMTGRCRALERDALLAQWRHRLMAGRKRDEAREEPPLVVVATQCVEVGADFDVDALVTECCSLDALRQRLGRLDRLGERGESAVVILARDKKIGTREQPGDDPIYGKALAETWFWLKDQCGEPGTVDLGTASLEGAPEEGGLLGATPTERVERMKRLSAPALDAPVIFPAYCDLWAQTGPEPAVSPEPAIFLHGPQRGEPEVRMVWRADLDEGRPEVWADTVSLCPPVSAECLSLPISQARRWLAGDLTTDQVADVEGGTESEQVERQGSFRPALRWMGPQRSEIAASPSHVRPGDTLVVPTSYRGCDREGWNPNSPEWVSDLADEARAAARRPAVLRVCAATLPENLPWPKAVRDVAGAVADEWPDDFEETVWAAVSSAQSVEELPPHYLDILAALAASSRRQRQVVPHPSGKGLVILGNRRTQGARDVEDFTDEDDTSSGGSVPVLLERHLKDVEQHARRFAVALGLPAEIVNDLALAARLHDLGKADPRFQAWLSGGSRIAARKAGLLAKSARMPANPGAMRTAREQAKYPEGARHEMLSVRLAESAEELLDMAHDRDLVLHLIASHHGHARPFAPVVFDGAPVEVEAQAEGHRLSASSATGLERLDSGVPERFWRLVRKYGWWGLAGLEACLRLADHRASENPAQDEEAE